MIRPAAPRREGYGKTLGDGLDAAGVILSHYVIWKRVLLPLPLFP